MMKKLLLLSGMMILYVPLSAVDEGFSVVEDHRFPLNFAQEIPLKKDLLEKCLLAGKGLGAGVASTLFGVFCYNNVALDTSYGSKSSKLFDKVSSLCAAGAAFVCAAKLGTYTVRCAKEILID